MNSEQPILVCTVAFVILCFQLLFTLTGAALAAAGALAAWVSFSPPGATVTYGFFASSITFLGQTTNSITAPVGQYGAAAALLLLGGNLAVIYFIALVVKVWIVCRVNQSLVNFGFLFLASLAFVCTFLGTILGGGVRVFAHCLPPPTPLFCPAPPAARPHSTHPHTAPC